MKNLRRIFYCLLLCLKGHALQAQSAKPAAITQEIAISDNKTTTLVFPQPLVSVDRGTADILAQKARNVDNVLQIKAAQPDFQDTNLTVITTDGRLYCFPLCYEAHPEVLTFSFAATQMPGIVQLDSSLVNGAELLHYSDLALHEKGGVMAGRTTDNGIGMALTGLFIHNEVMYYRLRLENDSPISYDIGQLRFFVRDQRRSNRTASQEIEILPVSKHPELARILPFTQQSLVFALPKFTIPDRKNLIIELTERNGGRHLQLRLKNRKAAKVIPLPLFN